MNEGRRRKNKGKEGKEGQKNYLFAQLPPLRHVTKLYKLSLMMIELVQQANRKQQFFLSTVFWCCL